MSPATPKSPPPPPSRVSRCCRRKTPAKLRKSRGVTNDGAGGLRTGASMHVNLCIFLNPVYVEYYIMFSIFRISLYIFSRKHFFFDVLGKWLSFICLPVCMSHPLVRGVPHYHRHRQCAELTERVYAYMSQYYRLGPAARILLVLTEQVQHSAPQCGRSCCHMRKMFCFSGGRSLFLFRNLFCLFFF